MSFATIQFPRLQTALSDYASLNQSIEEATASIPFFIRLGDDFMNRGMKEIDNSVVPYLLRIFPKDSVHSRTIPSYSVLKWFTDEVFG